VELLCYRGGKDSEVDIDLAVDSSSVASDVALQVAKAVLSNLYPSSHEEYLHR